MRTSGRRSAAKPRKKESQVAKRGGQRESNHIFDQKISKGFAGMAKRRREKLIERQPGTIKLKEMIVSNFAGLYN